ncbi:MAG: DUF4118 domain-containing protein [Candidatus Rokubacteria bacterium]|nr:DUF4118 domain-containing protein [Candidatus Rokubacteria bacterium]
MTPEVAAPNTRPIRVVLSALGAALAVVPLALALVDPRPDAALRHAYLPVVVLAGAFGGVAAGLGSAVAAVLFHAPFVLPAVERDGLSRSTIEALATFAVLMIVGSSTGALAAWATREQRRADLLVLLQRALTGDVGLADAVERARTAIQTALDADVAVLVGDGDGAVTAGRPGVPPGVIDAVVADGRARWLPDVGAGVRPERAVVAPILVGGRALGVVVCRRAGEWSRAEQATITALGVHLGVALENARLGAAQRRFAAELAEKVATATRELQALDRAKSAFVAVASHELRTPLTALRGFSELLSTRTFSDAEVRRFARVMQEETERLVRIVDDLLDLSRLEQGRPPPLRRAAVDARAAMLAVAAFFERQRDRVRLVVEAPPELPAVHADPDALDRILRNLVGNAIKYAPAAPITIAAHDVAGDVEFIVEDRGPGIPADALPRLFEPYFRVGDGTSGVRGTGLGLAIVRALVEAHGGRVRVESALEIGTRVRFTMPRVH